MQVLAHQMKGGNTGPILDKFPIFHSIFKNDSCKKSCNCAWSTNDIFGWKFYLPQDYIFRFHLKKLFSIEQCRTENLSKISKNMQNQILIKKLPENSTITHSFIIGNIIRPIRSLFSKV